MQIDPVLEWQRLTAEYRQKSPEELLELAGDFADLTEAAQQALRSEMRSRGLGDPAAPEPRNPGTGTPRSSVGASVVRETPGMNFSALQAEVPLFAETTGLFGIDPGAPRLVPDTPDTASDDDGPHEYTWKTELCECETSEQAQELSAALQQAGIDNWIEHPGATFRYRSPGLENPRVLVAADQLDQARAIAAKPIAQEVVDEAKEEALEFVEPKCPKCGSDDVVLEGVDPENTWRCEQCDEQWTETRPKTEGEAPKAAQNSL